MTDQPAGGQPPSDGMPEESSEHIDVHSAPVHRDTVDRLRRLQQPATKRVGPSDGMPSEPSEEAIAAAMSFADGDAASHTSVRGSDYSRKEWTRLFLAAAYAAERGVSAVPPTQE